MIAMQVWKLYWSPEGKPIAIVRALTEHKAVAKAPAPYSKYPGEIYAELFKPS